MKLENVRTRFAPSPTGLLHFGNANTALFNWLVARAHGGAVTLRIGDTDTERSTRDFERKIMDDLAWLGIDWDEGPDKGGAYGPYRQSERTHIYREQIDKLLASGAAYRCYCSREQLEQDRARQQENKESFQYVGRCRYLTPDDWARLDAGGKPFVVRLRKPAGNAVTVRDMIRGDIVFEADAIDDFIFVRSNGEPTFLLTNAVDDSLMRITHVVRGEDHISNTPKQILILNALSLPVPQYMHTAIILGKDKTKLSKRHGAVNVSQFREQGFVAQAMVNYLAFLGWNPKDEREFFTLEELKNNYSIEAMSKNPSIFDYDRLRYLNQRWIAHTDPERILDLTIDFLIRAELVTPQFAHEKRAWIRDIVAIMGDRLKTINDIEELGGYFFKDFDEYHPKGVKKYFDESTPEHLELIERTLSGLDPFTQEGIDAALHRIMEEHELPPAKVIHPLRLALTGKIFGPGLFELAALLGKDKTIERIRKAAQWIRVNIPS